MRQLVRNANNSLLRTENNKLISSMEVGARYDWLYMEVWEDDLANPGEYLPRTIKMKADKNLSVADFGNHGYTVSNYELDIDSNTASWSLHHWEWDNQKSDWTYTWSVKYEKYGGGPGEYYLYDENIYVDPILSNFNPSMPEWINDYEDEMWNWVPTKIDYRMTGIWRLRPFVKWSWEERTWARKDRPGRQPYEIPTDNSNRFDHAEENQFEGPPSNPYNWRRSEWSTHKTALWRHLKDIEYEEPYEQSHMLPPVDLSGGIGIIDENMVYTINTFAKGIAFEYEYNVQECTVMFSANYSDSGNRMTSREKHLLFGLQEFESMTPGYTPLFFCMKSEIRNVQRVGLLFRVTRDAIDW